MSFIGSYTYKLDSKNRMRLPAVFRDDIRDNLGGGWRLCINDEDNCLTVYPAKTFQTIAKLLGANLVNSSEDEAAMELFFGDTMEGTEDNQGRFVLPERFRTFAGIDTEVVFVGVNNHINIWAKEAYDKRQSEASRAAGRARIRALLEQAQRTQKE